MQALQEALMSEVQSREQGEVKMQEQFAMMREHFERQEQNLNALRVAQDRLNEMQNFVGRVNEHVEYLESSIVEKISREVETIKREDLDRLSREVQSLQNSFGSSFDTLSRDVEFLKSGQDLDRLSREVQSLQNSFGSSFDTLSRDVEFLKSGQDLDRLSREVQSLQNSFGSSFDKLSRDVEFLKSGQDLDRLSQKFGSSFDKLSRDVEFLKSGKIQELDSKCQDLVGHVHHLMDGQGQLENKLEGTLRNYSNELDGKFGHHAGKLGDLKGPWYVSTRLDTRWRRGRDPGLQSSENS